MKLSVSLPEEDVRFIDEYSTRAEVASRSSVIQLAIARLRESELQDEYAAAFAEWDVAEDAGLWNATDLDVEPDATR